jgi:hypothetical protein
LNKKQFAHLWLYSAILILGNGVKAAMQTEEKNGKVVGKPSPA